MTEILARLFSKATVGEIKIICYLSLGRLVPLYESLEFQLAEKMVVRVLEQAFEISGDYVRKEYKRVGDLGEVAEKLKREAARDRLKKSRSIEKRQEAKLTVEEVYDKLLTIAKEAGEGSQQRKVLGLVNLLHELDPLSCRYVVRIVVGKLRLGFSDITILDGLSWMQVGSKELRSEIEKAYFVRADVGYIAQLFKKRGVKGLRGMKAELGVPVMPALCQRLKSAEEMIKKMGKVIADPKYDGQRVQIHWRKIPQQSGSSRFTRIVQDDAAGLESVPAASSRKGHQWEVRAYTRNLEEVSFMFPELDSIQDQVRAEEVILDSEAVGYSARTGKILSFQEIITRKRKHAIAKAAEKVPLKFYVFDILFKNGKSLLNVPLAERMMILEKTISGDEVLTTTPRIMTTSANELRKYHRSQLKEGLEGVVVKKWKDGYIPGRRGWSWVKFKETEERAAKLSDTLDCVVMGYYRGRGKRAAFGIGGFLVGILKGNELVTISKIGTGLSDEQWREMKSRADKVKVYSKPKDFGVVEKSLVPDIWVIPKIVVEIAADNITKSPNHSAGLALRFPRLVRFRDDKNVSNATTIDEVRGIYKLQV
jgi:DNA ligase-1